MVDQAVVKVLTTQVSVTSSRLNLEDTLLNSKKRNIKSTTTKVENQNVTLTLTLLVKTVGDGSSSRLVDDTENVKTSNKTRVLSGLTLRVVEVSRDSDDSVVDSTTKESFSSFTHLGQDHSRNFFGSELLCLALEFNLDVRLSILLDDLERPVFHIGLNFSIGITTSDQTLGVEDSVVRVHGNLVTSSITNQTLGVCEGNERRSGTVTLVIGNDFDTVITEETDTRVRCTQVNTNSWSHCEMCEYERKKG